jgi:hypothetical protein
MRIGYKDIYEGEYVDVELHALANATKRPIIWKRLDNTFILSALLLTCGSLRPKHGPKVGCNIFTLYCTSRVLNLRSLGFDTM